MSARHRSYVLFLTPAILAAAFFGTRWLVAGFQAPGHSPQTQSSRLQPSEHAGGVVAIGFVDLEHGVAGLYPVSPARVRRVLAEENQKVTAATGLIAFDDEAARAQVAEARAALDTAQTQLGDARQAPKRHEIRLAAQNLAIEAATERLSAAQHLLARKRELERDKLLNSDEAAAAADLVKELTAVRDAEQRKLAELQLQDPARDVARAEAEVKRAKAQVRQAEKALAECTLTAPQDGIVLRILAAPGDVLGVQGRQPPVLFAANEPWIVRAEINQEFAEGVAVGQAVQIVDDIHPSISFRGRITRISDWYLQRREVLREPTRFNDVRTMECIISLDENHPPLKLGQRMRVFIDSNLVTGR
jgi:HlyD family secretion protein